MKSEERRKGAALIRESKVFSVEDVPTTWRLFVEAFVAYLLATGTALLSPLWPLQLLAGVVAGGVLVRLFIFYHDYLHGAIFRTSKLGHAFMVWVGWWLMAPPPVWRQTHDYHHRNNAKMVGASIGSFPVVTTDMWKEMNASQRFWYTFARHPLTILFGYFTIFIGGMCVSAFLREPKTHWQGIGAMLLHFAVLGGVGSLLGVKAAFFGVFLPLFVACALGGYLFYVQHNFPTAEIRARQDWTYHHAALRASSMFDMPAWMHWFTGNIGYHHVHHLNHQIPFYRLPEAMAGMEALQDPGRTSWRLSDIVECLRLKFWDVEKNRFVGWDGVSA